MQPILGRSLGDALAKALRPQAKYGTALFAATIAIDLFKN
jgi:hypothetical protein